MKPLFPVRGDAGKMLDDYVRVVLANGLSPNKMVEVGAYAGLSASIFSKHFNLVFSVDPWIDNYDVSDKICDTDVFAPIHASEQAFDDVTQNLSNVIKMKMFSHEAADHFGDKTLDFVYIDADHQYEPTLLDLKSWLPKIKPGGIIGGHDWDFESVQQAVQEILGGADVAPITDQNWYKKI